MFTGLVRTQWCDDGVHMIVLEELTFTDADGRVWKVPAGFVTDGASIPDEFWSLIGSPFTGKYRVAAVFHDAAYATLGVLKSHADNMLYEAMIALGCSRLTADVIYEGVRVGGQSSYDADQAAAANAANIPTSVTAQVS